MAKNQPKASVAPRVPRSKTPAQILKAAANIEAARLRLEKLQAKQKLARQLRERDTELKGNDDQVIEQYLNLVFVECSFAIAAIETAKAEAAETSMAATRAKYVAEALIGPSANRLNRFLAGRPATFERVDAFFSKSGLPRVARPAPVKTAA